MELEITLGKGDWITFQSYLEKELPNGQSGNFYSAWIPFIVLLFILGVTFMAVFRNMCQTNWVTAAIAVGVMIAIIFGLFIYRLNKLKKLFAPSEAGPFVGTHMFTINDKGIHTTGKGYSGFYSWSVVKKIARTNGVIMVFIDTAVAYVFPESQLKNPEDFLRYLTECNNGVN